MVILGAEVNRGELAIFEVRGQRCIAPDQRLGRVAVPFGLKHLVALNAPQLADRAIHRTHPIGLRQWARTFAQGAGKKRVEGLVFTNIGLRCLLHVDFVAAHKISDQGLRPGAAFGVGHASCQLGRGKLWQKILQKHK